VLKELEQFNVYNVFEALYAKELSNEEKSKTLTWLNFMKEKQDGKVKARSCANGSIQREHVAKEEAAAPMVALKLVFLTSTINVKEKKKIITINILGAFLHVNNDNYLIMKMNGSLAKLMVKTVPKIYQQIHNNSKRETSFLSASSKGLIRHDEERPAIQQKAHQGAKGNGF
jgi:hypothetical protein